MIPNPTREYPTLPASQMKARARAPRGICAAGFLLALGLSLSVQAPSANAATTFTWSGASSGVWSLGGNWVGSTAAGTSGGTTDANTALFNNNVNTAVTVDAGRNISSILFDTSAGSFTFSSGSFTLSNSGSIALLSTATTTGLTETFNSPITLQGAAYAFTNAQTGVGSSLVFAGNITDAVASTLTLSGAGTGSNIISGSINNGGGALGITLTATAGKWTFSGTNNYSGLTNVDGTGGTLVLSGSNTSAGAITLTKGTLQLDNASNGGMASGALTLAGGTLQSILANQAVANTVSFTASSTISGTQSITLNGVVSMSTGSRTLTNSITSGTLTIANLLNVNAVSSTAQTLTLSGGGTTDITGVVEDVLGGGTATAPGTLTITAVNGNVILAGTNTFSGTTAITTGTLIITGSNTSAGATTLSGGSLQLNNNFTNGGLASGTLNLNGGTLLPVTAAAGTLGNAIGLATASTTISGSQNVTLNGVTTSTATGGGLTNSLTAGKTLTVAGNVFLSNTSAGAFTTTFGGAGTTLISGNIADIAGGGAVTAPNTLAFSNTGTTTLTGSNSYAGLTSLTGAGVLVMAGTNTSAGATTISAGTLQLDSTANGGLASGTLSLAGGAIQALLPSLSLSNAINLSVTTTISGTQGLTLNGPITEVSGGNHPLNSSITNGGTLTIAGNVNTGNAANETFTLGGSGNTVISGTIQDTAGGVASAGNGGTLSITNTGTTTLTGSNTYSGVTNFAGTLLLDNASNGGLGTSIVTGSGGTLQSLLPSQTLSNMVVLTGPTTVSGSNSILISGTFEQLTAGHTLTSSITNGGALTLAGTVDIDGATAGTGLTLTLAGSGNTTISGTIQDYTGGVGTGSGHGALSITNTGTTTLSATNTYTGLTTLNSSGGTLVLSASNATTGGLTLTSGTLNINNNGALGTGTISLNGGAFDAAAGSILISGNNAVTLGTVTFIGSNNLNFGTGTVSAASNSVITVSSGTLTFGGQIALTGGASSSITINGPGTVIFSGGSTVSLGKFGQNSGETIFTGSNNFSGSTTINGGIINYQNAFSLGGTSAINEIGGTVQVQGGLAGGTNAMQISGTGAGSLGATGALESVSGTNSYGGSVSLNSNSTIAVDANSLTLNGRVQGAFVLTKAGVGNLILSNTVDTFSGGFNINSGTVTAGAGASSLGTGTITMADGTVLDLNGNSPTTGLLSYTNTGGTNAIVTNNAANTTSTLLVTATSGSTNFAGTITNGAGTSGTVALTKQGASTLTLSGSNSYTGATTVNANSSILVLTGTLNGSSVTVSNALASFIEGSTGFIGGAGSTFTLTLGAATLGGSNSYTGATSVTSGTLTLTGTMNGSNVIVNGGAGTLFTETNTGLIAGAASTFTLTQGLATLGGSNSYGGGTTLTLGTLNFANGGLGSGTLTFGGGVLQYATGNTQDVSSSIGASSTGAAAIDVDGNTVVFGNLGSALTTGLTVTNSAPATGALVLGGTQVYSGLTTVNSGTLRLGALSDIASTGTLTTGAAGTFDLNGNNQTLAAVTNNGTITNAGAGTPTLTMGNASTGAVTGNTTGTMNVVWNQAASNSAYAGTFSNTGNVTLNANGAGSITVGTANNTGTVTNSGAGTATTIITAGGTNVTNYIESSASSALTITTLVVNGVAGTTLTGSNASGTALLTATTVSGSGNLVLNNDSAVAGGVVIGGVANNVGNITNSGTGTGSATITGAIGSNVVDVIENSSTSLLNLTAGGAFTGGLFIKSGTVAAAGPTTAEFGAGIISLGDTVSDANNVTLTTNRSVSVSNGIIVNAAGTTGTISLVALTTQTPVFSGTVGLNNNLTLDSAGSGGLLTMSGQITGSGTITKGTGAGEVLLSGANGSSFTGGVVIIGGILGFTNGGLGSGAVTFGNTSTLQWATGNSQDISVNGISSAGSSVAGTLDLQANNVNFATANGLTGSGNITKQAASTGILTLSASNNLSGTYTAATTGGATLLNNTNALQAATVNLAAGTTVGGLSFSNIDAFTLGALTGSGKVVLSDTAANAVALSVGNNNSSTTYSGVASGNGSLVKLGTGALTLTGASTYTGNTTVSSGTLIFGTSTVTTTGTITSGPIGSGTLIVNNNTTLSNTATEQIGNSVAFNGQNITFTGAGSTAFDFKGFASGSALTTPGTVTTVAGANWTVNNTVYIAENVAFTPSGTTSLTVGGTGLLDLLGNNDFGSGSVVVNTGTLELGGGGANYIGHNGSSGLSAANTNVTNWQVNGAGVLEAGQTGGPSLLFGNGTITLNNGGTLTTANTNTSPVITNSVYVMGSGGSLNIGSTLNQQDTIGNLFVSAPLLTLSNTFVGNSEGYSVSGTAQLQNNVTINVYATNASSSQLLYINFLSGLSDDGNNRSLTVTGTGGAPGEGSVEFSGSSTYTGTTAILDGGVINLNVNNGLPDTALTIDSTSLLDLTNKPSVHAGANGPATWSQRLLGLNGSGGVTNIHSNTQGGASTLTLDDTNAADFYAFSGTISDYFTSGTQDPITLVKTGASTQILSGSDSYHGTTTIVGGVLQANDGVGLPTLSTLIFGTGTNTGGVLQGNGLFTRTVGTGTGNVNWAAVSNGGFAAKGGTLTVALGGTASPTSLIWGTTANFIGQGQTLLFGSTTSDSLVNFENAVGLASGTTNTVQVTLGTGTDLAQMSGVISGASTANLIKTGSGTLLLSATNTYAGMTSINGGILQISNTGALGTGSSPISFGGSGGTLDYTGAASGTLARAFNLSSAGQIQVDAVGQTLTISGTGINTNSSALTFSGSGNTAISGTGISGNGGVTKNGTGTLTMNLVNAYTGPTTINNGVVSVNNLGSGNAADSLGSQSDANSNNADLVINGGVLQYTGGAATTDRNFTVGANGATLDASGSGAIVFNPGTGGIGSPVSFASGSTSTLTLTGTNTGLNTASFYITDGGGATSVTKNGTGTWVLNNGANDYSGLTTINNGILQVGALAQGVDLGNNAGIVLGSGSTTGTLQYTGGGGGGDALVQNITVGAGGGVLSNIGTGVEVVSGILTKAHAVLTFNGGTFNVTGQITGGTSLDFNSDLDVNNATVTVSATNNNYTGPTVVYDGGTLLDGVNNALPAGTVVTTGSSTDGAVTNTYNLNGFNQSIAALDSAGTGTNIVTNTGTSTLTLTGTNSDSSIVSGSFGGSIGNGSGQTSLAVSGGTQTLGGSNGYTGNTTISSGTLALVSTTSSNNIASSAQIIVGTSNGSNAGLNVTGITGGFVVPVAQTLSGYGTVTGAVTVNGKLTPGTGTGGGTLTFASGLTIGNGAALNYGLGSTGDLVAVTGNLTLSGSAILNFLQAGTLVTGTAYDLINFTGSLTGGGNLSTWTLGTGTEPVGATGYTFAVTSGTEITITFNSGAAVTPAVAYWQGALGASGSGTWATVTSGSTNFVTSASGTANTQVIPGPVTNVKFTANSAGNLNTVLGQDFTINSLEFTGSSSTAATSPVTIGGTNTLTIMAGGTNGNTAGSGIVVDAGSASHTISSNVALGSSQTWTVSGSALTASGNVSSGSNAYGLTKSGMGTLILSGSDSYSGATAVNAGTLEVDGSLSGSSAVTVGVATLSGTGNIGGNVALTGTSNLSSAGTLTVASLAVNNVGNTISSGTVDATGGTTLNANSGLAVNGTLEGTVSIGSGATLSGTGTVTAGVTVGAGGITSPGGTSTGVMTTDLAYSGSSTANFNVASTGTAGTPQANLSHLYYSQMIVTGGSGAVSLGIGAGMTLGANSATSIAQTGSQILSNGSSNSGVTLQLTISSTDYATLQANASANYNAKSANTGLDNYFVFNLGSTLSTGRFTTLDIDVTGGPNVSGTIFYAGASDRFAADGVGNTVGDVYVNGQEYALSYTGVMLTNSTIGGDDIVLTAIPEPSTWGMILGGFGMLIGFQRFRKRRIG